MMRSGEASMALGEAQKGDPFSPRGVFPLISCHFGFAEHTARNDQIGQGEETMELGEIFPQPPVSNLPVFEEVLDDMEGMLHPCSHLRLAPFPFPDEIFLKSLRHRLNLSLLGCHQPVDLAPLKLLPLLHPKVSRISVNPLFLPMEEMLCLTDVADIGGRCHKAVNQPGVGIRSN